MDSGSISQAYPALECNAPTCTLGVLIPMRVISSVHSLSCACAGTTNSSPLLLPSPLRNTKEYLQVVQVLCEMTCYRGVVNGLACVHQMDHVPAMPKETSIDSEGYKGAN